MPPKKAAAPEPSTVELKVKIAVSTCSEDEKQRLLLAHAEKEAAAREEARQAAAEAGEEPPEEVAPEEQDDGTPIEEKLEGLGCTFKLALPGCSEEESEVINTLAFEHEFAVEITVSEDMALKMCKEVEGNISLGQAGEEAPMIILPVDLAPMVAGDRQLTLPSQILSETVLGQAPFFIKSFSVSIVAADDILSEDLRQHLNPLCITVLSLNDLPAHDVSNAKLKFEDLHNTCRPAYCQYSILGEDVETHGMLQAKSLKFRHKKVICAGLRDATELTKTFKSDKVRIVVHDRDKRAETPEVTVAVGAEEGGEDGEEGDDNGTKPTSEEKPPVWSGLKTVDYERWKTPKQPDPVGVADLDLSEMITNKATSLVLTVDVFPLPDDKEQKRAQITRKPPPKAAFLDAGTTVTVKVQLSCPLEEGGEEGPFQRVVVVVPYADNERLFKIEELVTRRNSQALRGHVDAPLEPDMDPQMLKKSLSTVELTDEQRADPNLDLVTGLQIIQANHRMFILEGPFKIEGMLQDGEFVANLASGGDKKGAKDKKGTPSKAKPATKGKSAAPPPEPETQDGAMVELIAALPRLDRNAHPGMKILYNPDITFSRRLYGEFDADIRRIRLRKTLKELITRADTSLEEKYRPCSLALNRLWDIIRSSSMRQARTTAGFPEVYMLNQMYKKYGEMLTRQDLDGVPAHGAGKGGAGQEETAGVDLEEIAALKLPGRPKRQPPTEHSNSPYLSYLTMQKERGPTDFVDKNKENVHLASETNRAKGLRPVQLPDEVLEDMEICPYSTQALNFAKLHLDALRHRYKKDYGKIHWTYSKDFLSGALILVDPEDERRRQNKLSQQRFRTSTGMRVVQASKPADFRSLPKQLSGLEKDNLALPWVDPGLPKPSFHPLDSVAARQDASQELHAGSRFGRYYAHAAPQMYGGQVPVFGHQNPGYMDSIHAVIGGGQADRAARLAKEQTEFYEKLKADTKSFTALLKQPAKANQIDKFTTSILKDAPRTYFGRTMPNPQGITTALPVNANALEEWKDPADTATITNYGSGLHIAKDLSGKQKMSWLDPVAVGVKVKREMESVHDKPFNSRKLGDHDIFDKTTNRIKLPAILDARGKRREQEDASSPRVQMLFGRQPKPQPA